MQASLPLRAAVKSKVDLLKELGWCVRVGEGHSAPCFLFHFPLLRLHRRSLHHSLPLRLQAQRMVQLVPLQQILWQRREGSVQVAARKAL